MRFLVLLLLSLMSMSSSLFHGTDSKELPLSGGYQPIKNLTDPHIIDVAKFAVSEYNKESGSHLIFQKIVSGKSQVVAGMNYILILEAKDGKVLHRYEAKVYENLKHNLQLVYFKLSESVPLIGGYQDIENLTDPHIQDIAKFAVLEYNKESGSHLIYKKIVGGKYQVVAGTNYNLTIEAKDGPYLHSYEAKVFEDLKMNLKLNNFTRLLEKKAAPVSSAIWKPVENLEKDMHILEIARNAVLEHNKELMNNKANNSHDDHVLVFEKVVSAETLQQEVDHLEGVKYRLVISANGAKYEALVWEKVTSFKPLP